MKTHDVSKLEHNDAPIINEQQRLLDAIWSDDPEAVAQSGFDARGIQIYRRNLLANAKRALSISFPTVFELLDSDMGEYISLNFLKLSPPDQGDWAQWGNELACFIATTKIGQEYPYLQDCTRLDWHVHCALHGVDQIFDSSTLQLLADCEPEHIFITFNANVKLINTKYPVTDIFYAHHSVDEFQQNKAMNKAQQALSSVLTEQTVMVYRPEFKPKVTKLTDEENTFISALMSGKSLGQSLNAIERDSHFSFENWLVKAIEQNLIYNFKEN